LTLFAGPRHAMVWSHTRHGIERVKRARIEDEKRHLNCWNERPWVALWETDSVQAKQRKARNPILVNLPPSATRDIDGPKHWRHLHRQPFLPPAWDTRKPTIHPTRRVSAVHSVNAVICRVCARAPHRETCTFSAVLVCDWPLRPSGVWTFGAMRW